MKMYVYLVMLFFVSIIIHYVCLKIQSYLEGFSSKSGTGKTACSEIANSNNTESISRTENSFNELKSLINKLLSKVSKSTNDSENSIKKNIVDMKKNISNSEKVNDAVTPDK